MCKVIRKVGVRDLLEWEKEIVCVCYVGLDRTFLLCPGQLATFLDAMN